MSKGACIAKIDTINGNVITLFISCLNWSTFLRVEPREEYCIKTDPHQQ